MNPNKVKNLLKTGVKLKAIPPPIRRYRIVLFQRYLILATAAFLILAFLARATPYSSFDPAITQLM